MRFNLKIMIRLFILRRINLINEVCYDTEKYIVTKYYVFELNVIKYELKIMIRFLLYHDIII